MFYEFSEIVENHAKTCPKTGLFPGPHGLFPAGSLEGSAGDWAQGAASAQAATVQVPGGQLSTTSTNTKWVNSSLIFS